MHHEQERREARALAETAQRECDETAFGYLVEGLYHRGGPDRHLESLRQLELIRNRREEMERLIATWPTGLRFRIEMETPDENSCERLIGAWLPHYASKYRHITRQTAPEDIERCIIRPVLRTRAAAEALLMLTRLPFVWRTAQADESRD